MLDRSARHKRQRRSVDLEEGVHHLPPGWKEKIDGWWRRWVESDPGWPAMREKWVALGPEAEEILVENLIRYYVMSWDRGRQGEIVRTERELLGFPKLVPVYLVAALAAGYGDSVVRNMVGELLARMGAGAVPFIEKAWAQASAGGRQSLARVLKKMRHPAALPLLIEIAGGSETWKIRIEAIQGLGELGDRRGIPPLLASLRDEDLSVRKFAILALARLNNPGADVLQGLVAAMEHSLAESRLGLAALCGSALRHLTGQHFATSPRVWRRWLKLQGTHDF